MGTEPDARALAARAALVGTPREPGAPKPDPVLVVDGLRCRLGPAFHLDVGHLEFQRGAITAIVGPNGAGKTTLISVLSGFVRADAGRWRIGNRDLSGRRPDRIAAMGLGRTFATTRSLAKRTVHENVVLAGHEQKGGHWWRALVVAKVRAGDVANGQRATDTLRRFGLEPAADRTAAELSIGERKLLALARSAMANPAVLLLDEPTAGTTAEVTEQIAAHLRGLRAQGITPVFVEHNLRLVRSLADWVVVMDDGRVVAEGPPGEVEQHPAAAAYFRRRTGHHPIEGAGLLPHEAGEAGA